VRAEGGEARVGELVDQPGDQRRLGADDDEVDPLGAGGVDQTLEVVGGDVEQPRVGGDAGVAGRADEQRLLR